MLSRYSLFRIHVGDTSSLLMTGDVGCYVTKTCTVRFILGLGKVKKTLQSQITKMNDLVEVNDHHVNCWE